MEKKIRTTASIDAGSFSAALDEVELRNKEKSKRIHVKHSEAAAIVPFISDSKIIMVEQFRYALGKTTIEIPAGKIDHGESPEQCAKRELLEETGYSADSLELIIKYAPAIGYSDEFIYLYSAKNIKKQTEKIDEREISDIKIFSFEEIKNMIKNGELIDGKTILALSFLNIIQQRRYI